MAQAHGSTPRWIGAGTDRHAFFDEAEVFHEQHLHPRVVRGQS